MRRAFFVLMLLTTSLFGRSEDIISSLAAQRLSETISGYYVADVVIAQREDSCLGYVKPYATGNFNFLFFEKSIQAELKEFLKRSMPSGEGLRPVIIRVNRFFIFELEERSRAYACADMSLSFIFPRESGLNEDFTSSVRVILRQRLVPLIIPGLIVQALDQSFRQYSDRSLAGLIIPKIITPEQVKLNPLEEPGHFHCFAGGNRGKGIYRTFFDFRDNTPDTSIRFKVIHHYNTECPELTKTYLKFIKGQEPEKVWGFYEGDSVYFNGTRYYSLLSEQDGHFFTYNRIREYNPDIPTAIIIGGVVGGVIGASIMAGIMVGNTEISSTEKWELDMYDGKLLSPGDNDYTRIASTTVFFLSKGSDPQATLTVYIHDQPVCELNPANYFTLSLSCHFPTAEIRFVSSTGVEASKTIEPRLLKKDVYLLKVRKKDRKVDVDHLHDQMKTDVLKNQTPEKTICKKEL